MKFPGFVGPTYTLQNVSVECQRTINFYPELDETGAGKNIASLMPTPGMRLHCTLPNSPIIGMIYTSTGRLIVVAGNTIYEVFKTGQFLPRATISSLATRVGMADNGVTVMIVTGSLGYNFDLASNTVAPIADFPGGSQVVFQDGYFIFNKPNSQTFYITNLYSTTIDPLNFASAEGNPDQLTAILSDHRELWLFGTESTEVWFNSGDPLFPFTRIDGAYITKGTAAPLSPARMDNTVYWLGQDDSGAGIVWLAVGYQPIRCSTFAVEQAISSYSRVDDATSFTYQQDGHSFYVLNFPTAKATWVYDAGTKLWHERGYSLPDGTQDRIRPEIHEYAFGMHIMSDYQNGNIYVYDKNSLDDAGNEIIRVRTSPYASQELKNIFYGKFQLDMRTGNGNDGVSRNPRAMLQWSDDGGESWSNEHWIDTGAIGEFYRRAIWRRLGRSRQRVFRVTISDPVKCYITDAFIDFDAGSS